MGLEYQLDTEDGKGRGLGSLSSFRFEKFGRQWFFEIQNTGGQVRGAGSQIEGDTSFKLASVEFEGSVADQGGDVSR